MGAKRKVAIVGAGFIAGAHIAALRRRSDATIAAVVDPALDRARALARNFGAGVYADVGAMLAGTRPDAAHVLTPPPAHLATAEPLLKAGVSVFLEKPMAETSEDCAKLLAAAKAGGAGLCVNHNFTHHPGYVEARRRAGSGEYGRARRILARYAAPLRQLTARQFGHWMFECARNLLLEQAVHPLSQIDELLGGIVDVETTPGPIVRPADGVELRTDFLLNLACRDGFAQLQVVLGATFPSWTLSILCDDGVIDADIYESRVVARRPHPAAPPVDFAQRNLGAGLAGLGAGVAGLFELGLEIARLRPASDGFNRSMRRSIAAFHDALAAGRRSVSESGPRLVAICERAAQGAEFSSPRKARAPATDETFEVAVLGGTGFIGRHLVRRLIDEDRRVAVLARCASNLPALFHDPRIGVFPGSVGDAALLDRVVRGVRAVVNLAHGGGGPTRKDIAEAMIGGARAAAEAARRAGAERYIFIGSSAALYLGDAREIVTMATPIDPLPDERGDYARAKILSERALAALAEPPIVVLRPAIVVGEGASPFHSALGQFENETHCIGWNDGRNPLPFVLADDVATAIAACLDADLDAVRGRAFNLVGDVRWNARQYIGELAEATGRPLKFHPSAEFGLMSIEWAKWGAKKIAGSKGVLRPSRRDIRSRGMVARFDASDEKRILNWTPCADEEAFRRQAILPHAGPR